MKRLALLALLVVGCGGPKESLRHTDLSEADFAPVNRCMGSWTQVVAEWVQAGGGLKASAAANVEFVIAGADTILMRIVLEAWRLQAIDPETSDPGVAFIRASSRYFPEGCRASAWLSSALQNDPGAASVDTASEARRLRRMPSDSDKRSVINTLVDELIAKPEWWDSGE